jgi:hypothetical protein
MVIMDNLGIRTPRARGCCAGADGPGGAAGAGLHPTYDRQLDRVAVAGLAPPRHPYPQRQSPAELLADAQAWAHTITPARCSARSAARLPMIAAGYQGGTRHGAGTPRSIYEAGGSGDQAHGRGKRDRPAPGRRRPVVPARGVAERGAARRRLGLLQPLGLEQRRGQDPDLDRQLADLSRPAPWSLAPTGTGPTSTRPPYSPPTATASRSPRSPAPPWASGPATTSPSPSPDDPLRGVRHRPLALRTPRGGRPLGPGPRPRPAQTGCCWSS